MSSNAPRCSARPDVHAAAPHPPSPLPSPPLLSLSHAPCPARSPEFRYLATIAVQSGKVFALFVRCPSKAFKANETKLRHIITTFTLLA
jgi:hypothetical protein